MNNACATGSNALFLARQAILAGEAECALAVGTEKMAPGSLGGGGSTGVPTSLDMHYQIMNTKFPISPVPPMPQFFGNAGRELMQLNPDLKPEVSLVHRAPPHRATPHSRAARSTSRCWAR